MAIIVDDGVMKEDLSKILNIGLIMILFSIFAIASNILNVYYSSKTAIGFATDLRAELFHKVQQFSFDDIDKFTPASLITRMTNDVTTVQQVLMMSMRLLLRAPLMMILAFFFIVRIAPQMAWIIGFAIPVLGVCIFFLLKKGLPYFIMVQQKVDNMNAVVRENLINIRVVKSFVREDFEKEKFNIRNIDLCETVIKASNIVITIMPVMQLIMNISVVAIFWVGAREIYDGALQVGELISFINYIMLILMSLMLVSMTLMMFARASASSKRIMEILKKQPSLIDSDALTDSEITTGNLIFRNVSFKYNESGENDVLRDISFEAKTGENIAIIGATGSAKTTLLQLIPRLYDVSGGEILVNGENIKNYPLETLRSSIGIVLQKDTVFSGTILDNLKWGNPDASMEEVIKYAEIAQAHEFIMSFPMGYNTVLGQGGVNISGGQKQRICLTRALLKEPQILILDDSTSAVDTDTERKIRENLKQTLKDTTVLMVTQRISSMVYADKIIVLEDGKMLATGTHKQLMETSETYREIYSSQQLIF